EPPELARNPLELARGVPEPSRFYSKRRRRRLLRMTKTDEKAMAAPAIIGSSRPRAAIGIAAVRSEEHTSELQSRFELVCRLLLEKKKEGARPADTPLHLNLSTGQMELN